MSHTTPPYADWKAPSDDGQILIWPEPQSLLARTRENSILLRSAVAVRIQNTPLPELRHQLRQWIGHDDSRLLIATGHQIELLHPGVWAKNILIGKLAERLGGDAYHIAVDTDAPKHLQLRWPGESLSLTDDPNLTTAVWAEFLETPTPRHLATIGESLERAAAQWNFRPVLPSFLTSMRTLGLESSSLTWTLTNAMHQLEWQLGLRHHSLLASPIWMSPTYLAFVHHILCRPDSFASTYNDILDDYRREMSIRRPGRPWPNLRLTPDCCEAPFWLDLLNEGRRERACCVRHGDEWQLRLRSGAEFTFDARADASEAALYLQRFLAAHSARLSPRALTLTAFLRLFLADQFVHGIGGARYDQVTDRFIARWFKMRPPAFSVTTATLRFPTAAGRTKVDLHPLIHEGHRLRHGLLGGEKIRLVRRIESLPRRSDERARLFREIHTRLASVPNHPIYKDWQSRFQQAERMVREQQETFDRELFFALQPADRLGMLIARYADRMEEGR